MGGGGECEKTFFSNSAVMKKSKWILGEFIREPPNKKLAKFNTEWFKLLSITSEKLVFLSH